MGNAWDFEEEIMVGIHFRYKTITIPYYRTGSNLIVNVPECNIVTILKDIA
jgi:hypothetical protein